jgi:FKBP-type peptidyl-prolyl cis-trans isomerase FklB
LTPSRLASIAAAIVVVLGAAACQLTAQPAPTLDTQQKKVSYAIGLNLGKSLLAQKVEVDFDSVSRGVKDGLAGTQALDDKQIQETMETFQKEMQTKMSQAAEKNTADGAQFLADNEKRSGVQKTASGLQYEVLTEGTGPKPVATDRVKVHYKGTLIDGTEFDSSYQRGEPAVFPANRVIPGWTEALQLMPVGSKWKLYIPAALGYGAQGAGAAIPPNATLIFEVELLGIEK